MSKIKGLTSSQAKALLEKYGLNKVESKEKRTIFTIFLSQFKNFFVYLLVSAALISFLLGEALDGLLILAIVFLNAVFGLYQEWKADEALQSLKKMMSFKVRVIRDGKESEIDSQFLVPGDVVVLEEGVRIPADGKVIDTKVLEVDEAVLTGESIPVLKKKGDEVFMGTLVVKGHGIFKVEKTGMLTSFGKIAEKLATVEKEKSPMEKKLEDLSRKIGALGSIAAISVLALGYFKGLSLLDSFLLAVSLAVAVIPEGLPAVMTMTLAIGVREMAKKRAIVRRLSSIEALGSITLIATDKTGTLTENKMEVKEVFFKNKKDDKAKELLLLNSILCSTASLVFTASGKKDFLGDPTEGALLVWADKQGLDVEKERENWTILEEDPFDSAKKMMQVKVKNKIDGREYYFSKGAPEVILSKAKYYLLDGKRVKLEKKEREEFENKLLQWASKGYRVLGFAFGEDRADTLIALVALYDPPRKEVKEAILKAKKAGIKTVMITGDNERTAAAIGQQVGLLDKNDRVLTGRDLENFSDEQLLQILPKVKAFARVSPLHKVKIVELYQKMGEVVAVTGDGVNDAIALKKADVGVAMGKIGTDVAREAADVVITDDNYATLVEAVQQGRNITLNIKNSIFYLLSCNTGEVFSLLLSLLIGLQRLFTPVQILFVNLVTDGVPALAFAFSPVRKEVMQQPPEKKFTLVSKERLVRILWAGFLSGLLVVGSIYFFGKNGFYFKRSVAFATLVLVQAFIFAAIWLEKEGRISFFNLKERVTPLFAFSFFYPFVIQYLVLSGRFASVFKASSLSLPIFLILCLYSGIIMVGLKIISELERG